MKKILILLLLGASALFAQRPTTTSTSISSPATSIAASSTNTTKGTALTFTGIPPGNARLYAYVSGVAGTTNAAGTATAIIRFELSRDGTNFGTATASNAIKLTIPLNGVVTNGADEVFNLAGATAIRVGQVENIALGVLTNLSFGISYNNLQ